MEYKGNLTPLETMEKLESNSDSVLLDVRTEPEWTFVGLPAVRNLLRVSWKIYPTMEENKDFVQIISNSGIKKSDEICVICRSGVRSVAAAIALTNAGFENCYNVTEGFEGDKDEEGHRSSVSGWKKRGLAWTQG
jgi:rhodanese-related sulfurtransferase